MRRYMKRCHVIAATLAALLAPVALHAQSTPAEQEVYSVVQKFFQAFNAKDTTAMRPHLFGDVKLFTTGTNQQGVALSECATATLCKVLPVIKTVAPASNFLRQAAGLRPSRSSSSFLCY